VSLEDYLWKKGAMYSYKEEEPENQYVPINVLSALFDKDKLPPAAAFTVSPEEGPVAAPVDRFYLNRKHMTGNKNNDKFIRKHEVGHILDMRNTGDRQHPLEKSYPRDAKNLTNWLKTSIDTNLLELQKRYPSIKNAGYLQSRTGMWKAPLAEIMSDLNAIEETYNVDLTKDPAFKSVFANRRFKAMYEASRSYRRTRMDARDPRPYTVDK
jgi:hypothetical protein